jgi:alanyl-tRNA synthetase
MTERLYYDDAYLTRFTARVVEGFAFQDRFAAVLDRTAFYPTSGGQPFDRGILGGVQVVDVLVRESDDAVLHLLDAPLADQLAEIVGEIDWERRFDHMQQHTGQHILSQAFLQVAQAQTVAFHLGSESATVDLAGPWPPMRADAAPGCPPRHEDVAEWIAPASPRRGAAEWMEQAELLANQIVWEDRPVTAQSVPLSGLSDVPLRKPPAVTGDVRVIQVAGFDWSACGGTHVARTGEIGLVKIVKWERRGDEMRVEFRCGRRALDDYRLKNSLVNRLAAGFNVGYWELDQAVERLASEAKELRSRLREAGQALAQYEAAGLRAGAPRVAGVRLVVCNLVERSVQEMRELARQLVSEPDVVALLGVGDHKAQFCFARSSNVDIDMVSLVRDTVETLGARRGGGQPDFAQGGGPLAGVQQLEAALNWATQRLRQQLTEEKSG